MKKVKSVLSTLLILSLMPTAIASAEDTTNSSELSFQIPMNTYCSQFNPIDFSFELVNSESQSANITLHFFKKDGTESTLVGSSYDGIESTLTPGTAILLAGNAASVFHINYGAQQSCSERVYSGKVVVNSGSASLFARGWVDSKRGSEKILINNNNKVTLGTSVVTPTMDVTPPAATSDLTTVSPTSSTITLNWTASGDDGTIGQATYYEIRYNTIPITDSNWEDSTIVNGAPAPSIAGTRESHIVGNLNANQAYYFALKTIDEAGNISPVSNVAVGKTDPLLIDLIPKMTSDTAPSGKASASTFVNPYTAPYLAFDDVQGNGPMHNGWEANSTIGWLEYEFPSSKTVVQYTIAPYTYNNTETGGLLAAPTEWTFEAYNENTSSWDILDRKIGFTAWKTGQKEIFTFTNSNSYKRYRINCTKNNGAYPYVGFGEMEMMGY
ncbi:fibronectin type III domain-containing protein [Paenibacillus ferrarius]|uniref:fibronectin type III domain-containing protein n=1 Tax=Paenibacillus ferrarius TaxID=1469647 RepID=UPI003D2A7DAF